MDHPAQDAGARAEAPAAVVVPERAAETSAERPWPLHRLSENLKLHIERAPATWIEGQLIEYKNNRGNVYMTMRDLEQEVSLPVTAWRSVAATFEGTVQQGSRVVARVKPSFWLKAGRLSMTVQELRPVGLGDLLARVELLRRALAQEGLTSPARKRPLPLLPGMIGLITGRDSDAKKDVLRNTLLRWPAARFEVREVAVQGTDAPRQVAQALSELDANPAVEVIVIARGGGALEEVVLPFSDEALVRAVAAARTPVVSAIGHEADRPVLDDVADLRASTPTDAAKRIVPDAAVESAGIADARLRLAAAVERRVRTEQEGLQALRTRPVLARPEVMVDGREEDLGRWRERGRAGLGHRLVREAEAVAQLRARVRALSPQQTLDRGYAVIQHRGALVRRAQDAAPGDRLDILVAAGRIGAQVTDTTPTDGPAGTAPAAPENERTPA
ncbi:exodeoxyribonuclease VII large subunit [Micrococcus sp.]|uniref:exodeoxyribonuclease VII large subunit n=1 Tax=Micrococcus sp. TaxID=1271 RepID=UPI002A915767|nr:exodeoxyribonuclease VII large subunit [Micrococcus sp.]MDY6055804.1 exodeoxyribonuclease VII large subunit [Micrococcus sp.]